MDDRNDLDLPVLLSELEEFNSKLSKLHDAGQEAEKTLHRLQKTAAEQPQNTALHDLLHEDYLTARAEIFETLHSCFSSVFMQLSESELLGGMHPIFPYAEENYELLYAQKTVYAFTDGTAVYVKLPLLPSVWNSARYARAGIREGHRIAANECAHAAYFALKKIGDQLPKICQKTVNYLFVFASKTSSAADNDNHECKAVTDAVCKLLLGGDSAETTDFTYQSLFLPTGELPEGTYITVVPERGKLVSPKETLTRFEGYLRNAKNASKF